MQVEDAHPIANDGFQIEFLQWGGGRNYANNVSSSPSSSSSSQNAPENVVILLHGWSGGPEYFHFSMQTLKHNEKTCYFAPRFRGHGCKDDSKGKFHIARLAKDVHDFIRWLKKKGICPENQQFSFVGTSMGCAVIWSFVELFGESEVKNYTFVDQAPLQNVRSDWCLGSTGCFDEASLKNLQSAVLKGPDLSEFADGNERACVAQGSDFKCEKEVKNCTMGCKPEALAELMADHTNLDWRPLVASLEKPALVAVGEKTQIFPWKGVAYVGSLMKNAQTMVCKDCGHWLYLEQPGLFGFALSNFISTTESGESQGPSNESIEADLRGGYEFYKDKFYFIDAKLVDYRFAGGSPEHYKLL
jgi:non-heme chloroperoxidase